MTKVSAPGKVHLIGEHAVVYGEPAIIAAVGRRTTVAVEKSGSFIYSDSRFGNRNEFSREEALEKAAEAQRLWKDCFEKKNFSELFSFIKNDGYGNYRKAAVGLLAKKFGIDSGMKIDVHSDVPAGSGLGSSSSLAVALSKAFAEFAGKNLTLDGVNETAFELEQIIHGTPSGGDNSTCCYGGLVWFQRSQPKNIITSLKDEINHEMDGFVLVYTKPPEKNTGELVQLVRNLEEEYRNRRVKAIGSMVVEMKSALAGADFGKVKRLMNMTQENLAELGVSIPEIDEIHAAVKRIGGAAKLCGAGGGGIMLCYHEDKQKLKETIRGLGYEPWEAELGVEGVRVEK
ncbi:MAG: mevalonate kinase [Candidatus Aenigmarchaeota archaeon]|nr:mevalonate kinase [Candidatus Aenigmarchaeota archaeon]